MLKKILVADDDANIKKALEVLLIKNGYQVLLASDGKEALEVIKDEALDLLILDIKMPGMNGIELLKRVRGYSKDLPIVILSGYSPMRNDPEIIMGNIAAFVDKPFGYKELVQKIKDVIGEGQKKPEEKIEKIEGGLRFRHLR